MKNDSLKYIFTGFVFLFLAVGIGAFGAHGLKNIVTGKYIETFNTGSNYHFIHSFSLILVGLTSFIIKKPLKVSYYSYIVGIFLFSFNCYLYAITKNKIFAMIVPIGGFAFLIGHFFAFLKVYVELKNNRTHI